MPFRAFKRYTYISQAIHHKLYLTHALDRQISTKIKKIEELEQKMYINAQGENFRNMRPLFDEER